MLSPQRRRQLNVLLDRLGLEEPPTDLMPVEEALTHTSARLPLNHERLEFLGDAVLRLAAALFLREHHPRLSVGQWSALRSQMVSDRWLSHLARRCDLLSAVHLGAMAASDRAGRNTVLAESCEALVGGIYEAWGGSRNGLAAVLEWLTPHWKVEVDDLLRDPHRHNWKSALQEWSQARGLGLPSYHCEERQRQHGDPERFLCRVALDQVQYSPGKTDRPGMTVEGKGRGGSRRESEQQAARDALGQLGILSRPGES
jgi:ribonuclease III